MTRRTRPPARPVTPRPPASPRQPPRPAQTVCVDIPATRPRPGYAVILWQAPVLRQRHPGLPGTLHEAIQLARHPDPEPAPPDHEAEP